MREIQEKSRTGTLACLKAKSRKQKKNPLQFPFIAKVKENDRFSSKSQHVKGKIEKQEEFHLALGLRQGYAPTGRSLRHSAQVSYSVEGCRRENRKSN